MINKRLINTSVEAEAAFDPLQNFETVTYTGNGGTQKITGYIRKGAAFNGSSKIVTTVNIGSFTDYSISFWLYTPTSAGDFFLGTINSSGNTGMYALTQPNGTIIWEESGIGSVTTTDTFTVGQWNHIVLVRNSGTNYVYININSTTSVIKIV